MTSASPVPATARPIRRSVYAERLASYSEFAFGDEAAFMLAGRWHAFFSDRMGNAFDGRITFEIGCADAEFLVRIAAKFPHTGFVGLDWKAKGVFEAAQRIKRASLRNVALIRGRAQDVRRIFADREVDDIWIFHPEPCDREVELKNRLIAEPFLHDAAAVMRDARSSLCLKTDHAEYFDATLQLIERQRELAIRVRSSDFWNDGSVRRETAHHAFSGETSAFEDRFRRKRKPIHYLELGRSECDEHVAANREKSVVP